MKHLKNDKGIILMVSLAVISILLVIVLEFHSLMSTNLDMASNFQDEVKAYYTAKSGINTAIALLLADDNKYDGFSEDWALLNNKPVTIDGGSAEVTVTDEGGKLNLNYLVENKTLENKKIDIKKFDGESIFLKLLETLGVERENISPVTDSTLDWIDKDDDSKTDGAEESFYSSLKEPYTIKNGPLGSVSEIKKINGYNDDILKKIGAKDNYFGKINPSVFKYITVSSDGLINVNTAEPELLQSLSENISSDDVDDIVKYREKEPFEKISDIKNTIITANDKWNSIKDKITVKSNYFSIISEGSITLNGSNKTGLSIKKKIHAIVKRYKTNKENRIKILFWKTQ